MILSHPISNKKAIEKYKDRKVKVYHRCYNKFLHSSTDSGNTWSVKENANEFTFKEALKKTKHYKKESGIEYHFISQIGEETPNIKDFDQEEVHLCTTISFDQNERN